jgi:hypothetical protein
MKKEYALYISLMLAVVFGIFGLKAHLTMGRIPISPTPYESTYEVFDFFVATTTNATSSTAVQGVKKIAGATKVTFFFSRDAGAGGNQGTSTFSAQVTKATSTTSTTDWVTYNRLIDNTTTDANVSSAIFSNAANYNNATSTKFYSMDLSTDGFYGVRCIVVEETDGSHSCSAYIEY